LPLDGDELIGQRAQVVLGEGVAVAKAQPLEIARPDVRDTGAVARQPDHVPGHVAPRPAATPASTSPRLRGILSRPSAALLLSLRAIRRALGQASCSRRLDATGSSARATSVPKPLPARGHGVRTDLAVPAVSRAASGDGGLLKSARSRERHPVLLAFGLVLPFLGRSGSRVPRRRRERAIGHPHRALAASLDGRHKAARRAPVG